MLITDEQLDEFIKIAEEKLGEKLDRATAYEFALKILQYVSIMYFKKPLPTEEESELLEE